MALTPSTNERAPQTELATQRSSLMMATNQHQLLR